VHISARGDNAWCINSASQIFEWVGGRWEKREGAAVKISVGDKNRPWCVNSADEVWKWNGYAWEKMTGALTDVSVNKDSDVWGCNRAQEIWHWNGSQWKKCDGAAVQISVARDGTVWCVNAAQQIWRRVGGFSGRWELVEGALIHVSALDSNTVIGNNKAHEIWTWNGRKWDKMQGATKVIAVAEAGYKRVWGVNRNEEIWHHNAGGYIPPPSVPAMGVPAVGVPGMNVSVISHSVTYPPAPTMGVSTMSYSPYPSPDMGMSMGMSPYPPAMGSPSHMPVSVTVSIPVHQQPENTVQLLAHPGCALRRRPAYSPVGPYKAGFRCKLCGAGNTPNRWCCEAHEYDICENCLAAQLGITLRVPGGYM